MSESITRRDAIRRAALSLTAVGVGSLVPGLLPKGTGEQVHAALQEAGDGYQPAAFLEHEWRLLRLLCEIILPADDTSGSALDAGAPEFIDLLASNNRELQRILTSGMLWLDHETRRRSGSSFVEAEDTDRTALLDRLAERVEEVDPGYEGYAESIEYAGFQHYTTEPHGDLGAGVRFFSWLRRLVVDAFYTSPIGIADVGYEGNDYLRRFVVPESSVRHALDRSPFRDE
jgi:hypothetical protein